MQMPPKNLILTTSIMPINDLEENAPSPDAPTESYREAYASRMEPNVSYAVCQDVKKMSKRVANAVRMDRHVSDVKSTDVTRFVCRVDAV